MAAAIQPRINKAISDRLRADTVASPVTTGDSLQGLLQDAGAVLGGDGSIPLWWEFTPTPEVRPYLVFRAQERQTEIEPLRSGEAGYGGVPYEVELVLDGIAPGSGLDILDRVGTLLDAYQATVNSVRIEFLRVGEFCYPDYTASEKATTRMGLVWRVQVRP